MNTQAGALHPGQQFVTTGGRRGSVDELLGAGGQGACYKVFLDGQSFALKWYHPHYVALDTTLRTRLDRSVKRGPPTNDFLWPLDLVDIPGSPSFGYVMPLRGPEYVTIRDLIAPPPRRLELSLKARATICQSLARSFLELHANGFCYQDLNFGNFFLDPKAARVLICDNDNVNIDGADASIYGTRKFMAPEVVRRETLPNSRTDLFSMSVLFFYTIFAWHPLDGRREAETALMDAKAEMKLYGTEPLFLFDPNDASNGPVEGMHDTIVARWNSLPSALRELFTRAFTAGLHDPAARVLETEWRNAFRIVEDATFACTACGYEHVGDPRRGVGQGRSELDLVAPHACLSCAQALSQPFFLLVGDQVAALTLGATMRRNQLDRGSDSAVAACVEAHPTKPDRMGLRNLTDQPWQVELPDGSAHTVPPGQVVRILPSARISFGRKVGRIFGQAAGGPA